MSSAVQLGPEGWLNWVHISLNLYYILIVSGPICNIYNIDPKILVPPFASHPQVWQVARCSGGRHPDLSAKRVRRPGSLAKGFGFWPGLNQKSIPQTRKYEIQPDHVCTNDLFDLEGLFWRAMVFHKITQWPAQKILCLQSSIGFL